MLGAPSSGFTGEKGLLVTQVALHPSKPQTVFALTTYGIGLLKSLDGGEHWVLANEGIRSFSLYQVIIDPRTPDHVYVGAGGGGLYVSIDGGATFRERNDGLGNTDIGVVVLHPTHPERLFIVTSTGVYRSPDQGRTWSSWNQGDTFTESQQFQDLVILTGEPEVVLLASKRGVFRRGEGEAMWGLASPDLAGRQISALARHPDGRRVFAAVLRDGKTLGGGGLYTSSDRGGSWRRLGTALEHDWVRAIRVDPRHHSTLYAATSSRGVLRSTDGGLTFVPLNEGLGTLDIRALLIDPSDPARLFAGSHGAGVFVSHDTGKRWRSLDRTPNVTPDAIIASLKSANPSAERPDLKPPPAFSKCNRCHGWTDPHLNQTTHSLWLMPANRRDWAATVRRMSGPAKLTSQEEREVADFLTAYSNSVQ